jgi:hypothetical protein
VTDISWKIKTNGRTILPEILADGGAVAGLDAEKLRPGDQWERRHAAGESGRRATKRASQTKRYQGGMTRFACTRPQSPQALARHCTARSVDS